MLGKSPPTPPQNLVRFDEDLETGRKHPPGLLMSALPLCGFIKEEEADAMPGPARMVVQYNQTYYQIIRTGEAAAIGRDNPYALHPAPPNATARIGHVAYALSGDKICYGEPDRVARDVGLALRQQRAGASTHPAQGFMHLTRGEVRPVQAAALPAARAAGVKLSAG